MKVTISLIKADIGSLAGHHTVIPEQIEAAKKCLEKAKKDRLLIDYHVYHVGDDLQLLMTHAKNENNPEIHKLAFDTFMEVTEKVSRKLKLYGAGQDLLSTAFSGNIKGMGPVAIEMAIEERVSEPFVVLGTDKAEAGVFNYYFYRVFADAMNTAGLIIDPQMHDGFTFRVMDAIENKVIELNCPDEIYDLIALIGTTGRYLVERILRRKDKLLAAVAGVTRLNLIAGAYKGKDDNVAMVRLQGGLPALGEALSPFGIPYLTRGWMRGSHISPLFPSTVEGSKPTYFDGPSRVVALGFNLCEGKLIGPADLFGDVAFDNVRTKAMDIALYLREHGEFQPERLGMDELEYTGIVDTLKKLQPRFKEVK